MPASRRLNVLIIEDDPIVALDEAQLVESFGHRVIGMACEAAEAAELVRVQKPSLVLLDVNLADGPTGPMLCDWLVGTCGVPVLFVTGSPEMLPRNFAGALGCVVKPYASHVLRAALAFAGQGGREACVESPPGLLHAPSARP
jgi:response regulator of citrate/malate metabolism